MRLAVRLAVGVESREDEGDALAGMRGGHKGLGADGLARRLQLSGNLSATIWQPARRSEATCNNALVTTVCRSFLAEGITA